MELRTDNIGHFDSATEQNIIDAVKYSGEGAARNDIVKLISDDDHFVSIWIGQRSIGHSFTLKSGQWKLDSVEKLTSETVVELMLGYLNRDLSKLNTIKWKRPVDRVFIDNIMELMKNN
jgi:hypothetical protein